MKKHGVIGVVVVMCLVLGATVFVPYAAYARIEGAVFLIEPSCFEGFCKIRHSFYSHQQNESVYLNYDPALKQDGVRFVNLEVSKYAEYNLWHLEKVSNGVYLIVSKYDDLVLTYQFYGGKYYYGCLKKREGRRGTNAQRWRLKQLPKSSVGVVTLENVELSRVKGYSTALHVASASPNWKTIMGKGQ